MKIKKFIEGLEIIKKYVKDDNATIASGHDIVWLCDIDLITDDKDIKKLEDLGFFEDEDFWACFT